MKYFRDLKVQWLILITRALKAQHMPLPDPPQPEGTPEGATYNSHASLYFAAFVVSIKICSCWLCIFFMACRTSPFAMLFLARHVFVRFICVDTGSSVSFTSTVTPDSVV